LLFVIVVILLPLATPAHACTQFSMRGSFAL